jgi:hypothetical protein
MEEAQETEKKDTDKEKQRRALFQDLPFSFEIPFGEPVAGQKERPHTDPERRDRHGESDQGQGTQIDITVVPDAVVQKSHRTKLRKKEENGARCRVLVARLTGSGIKEMV